jgi:glycosyltransferase involved in cell wall biosynthesis
MFLNPGGNAAGGAERSLALLMAGLVERGHELAVVTLLPGDAAEAFSGAGASVLADGIGQGLGGVGRHQSSGGFLRDLVRRVPEAVSTADRVRSLAASFGAHVIHTNGLRAHALTPLVAGRDRPVVWSLRERPPGSAARLLIRSAARRASAVIAPSAFAAAMVSRCRRPVYVIANPVAPTSPRDRSEARRALELPLDRPVVAVVAHLHPTKGQHVAVEAWQRLKPPRPLLVLAGGDLYGDASRRYRESLRSAIALTGLAGDVMLAGLVRDMPALYAASDLVVHPALYPEGFGRAVAEAQQAGVPVVASSIGAPCELIADGLSGALVPPGDTVALGEAVRHILGTPELYRRLSVGGLAAARRFEPAAHASAVESVYRAWVG